MVFLVFVPVQRPVLGAVLAHYVVSAGVVLDEFVLFNTNVVGIPFPEPLNTALPIMHFLQPHPTDGSPSVLFLHDHVRPSQYALRLCDPNCVNYVPILILLYHVGGSYAVEGRRFLSSQFGSFLMFPRSSICEVATLGLLTSTMSYIL